MGRQHYASGAPWEEAVGYSRAVRAGQFVAIAGTVAVDADGQVVGADAYTQARYAMEKAARALAALGGDVRDVVRTRMYVVDIARDHEAVGRAHREVFGAARPAATMVEVRALISPGLLVEVEVDAVVEGS